VRKNPTQDLPKTPAVRLRSGDFADRARLVSRPRQETATLTTPTPLSPHAFSDPDAQRRSNRQPTVGADAAPGDHACRVFLPDAADAPKGRTRSPASSRPKTENQGGWSEIKPQARQRKHIQEAAENRQIPEQPQATRAGKDRAPGADLVGHPPRCGRLRTVATYWALIAKTGQHRVECSWR